MLSQKMQDALNKQVNAELYSAYLYLSMSAYYESINLPGFANWMRVQYQEETFHGLKIYDYVNSRGGRAVLAPIEGPPREWDSALAPFADAYKHEQKVTAMINDLVNLALDERDHATNAMLQWFVNEQVEEEKNTSDAVQTITRLSDAPNGLFMVDRELAQRVYTPPATAAEGGA